MAMTLEELTNQLKQNTYTPLTEEEIQQRANNRYQSQYNQNRLSAQQQYDSTDLALSNQLASLGLSYDRQRRDAREATAQSLSSADRYSLQRGMQRSSYNNATLANINIKGEQTLSDIGLQEAAARQSIESQRTQLASQLAAQLAQYDTDYASDVAAYMDTLREQDYERAQAANQYNNQLLMALYEYGQKAGKSSSGSSRSSSSGSGLPQSQLPSAEDSNAYDALTNQLNLTLLKGGLKDVGKNLGRDLKKGADSLKSFYGKTSNIYNKTLGRVLPSISVGKKSTTTKSSTSTKTVRKPTFKAVQKK